MKVKTAPPSRTAVPATSARAFRAPWSCAPVSARPPDADVEAPPDDVPPPPLDEPPEPPEAPLACSVVSRVRETSVRSGVQVVVVPSASMVSTPGESVEEPLAPGL